MQKNISICCFLSNEEVRQFLNYVNSIYSMVQEIGCCCFRFLSGNAFLPWFRFPIFLGGVCNQTPEENRNISMFECQFSNVPIIFEWLFHLLLRAQQLRFMVQGKPRWFFLSPEMDAWEPLFLYKFGVLKKGWDHHIAGKNMIQVGNHLANGKMYKWEDV